MRRSATWSVAIGPRLVKQPGGLRRLESAALAALTLGRLVPLTVSFPLAKAAEAQGLVGPGEIAVGSVEVMVGLPPHAEHARALFRQPLIQNGEVRAGEFHFNFKHGFTHANQ